jgi:uncharacterized lipoprotein YmbA
MTVSRRGVLGLALASVVPACASPEPAYYTLAAVPGVAKPGAPAQVELRRIGLAGYLDRSEIVRANSAYSLRLNGTERWGEPFGDLVARILAENLNTRLPGTSVFTSAGSITTEAGATIEMDVQRFDADASGQAVLLAQVAVSRGRARASAATRVFNFTVRPSGPSTADLVAAMSTALGQLADGLATMLRAAGPAPPVAEKRRRSGK